MFLYGGSTIVVLLEKDAACIPQKIFENTEKGIETIVKYGSAIGTKK
jgi:phosphatidylserine decarboxylase